MYVCMYVCMYNSRIINSTQEEQSGREMRTPTHTVNFMQPLLLPPARMLHKKRQKMQRRFADFFDQLPDDLVVSVFCKLSSSAASPSHLINVFLTCKRFKSLALNPLVLAKASPRTLVGNPQRWSESAHRFLRLCVNAGNVEACYVLGMIRFYCFRNRVGGASLMAKAAIKSHAPALYALAVIQFNGSGASKNDKDLKAGVALCARAAFLGHIDALRELGHCLQDGYGVRQNIAEGRRLLLQANARELAFSLRALMERPPRSEDVAAAKDACSIPDSGQDTGCKLLTEFGLKVQRQETHPVNRFLKEWFESGMGVLSPELRLCSNGGCGRPETRSHEFRRCSVCGKVNYCSRGCQALDWRLRHKAECMAVERWLEDVAGVGIMGG